jgi:hypothetical protein
MLYIFLLLNIYIYCQDITFFQEDITFNLDINYFKVDGFYWFINHSNKSIEKLIYYPFDNNSALEQIDSVEVFDILKDSKLKISNLGRQGFSFLLEVTANNTAVCRIKYRQKIMSDSVKYILTSTQKWERPLENADYKLIVDKQIEITEFSYEPDKLFSIDGNKIYYWKMHNFMPVSDMIFRFK